MYGGTLRPSDPRRFLIEAIVGAMYADGVVQKAELEVMERNLQDHEMFAGLGQDIVSMLVEMARESMELAGGCLRRLPSIAKGLSGRSHRMAAYAVACEVAFSDGQSAEEVAYLNELRRVLLLGDGEAREIWDAAQRGRGMQKVEELTRDVQSILPWYLECMALVATMDGTVTESERNAVRGVLRHMGDMAALEDRQREEMVGIAFRRIEGKDPEAELRSVAAAFRASSDRYWAAIYMMVVAVAEGYTNWRQIWLLGTAQEILGLSDADMDRAMATAKTFPVPQPRPQPSSLPVGALLVVLVDGQAELRVAEIGPVVLVEAGSSLEDLLRHVQDQTLAVLVDDGRAERDGEQLVADAEHAAEADDEVGDAPGIEIDHDLLDAAEIFAGRVDDAIPAERGGREGATDAVGLASHDVPPVVGQTVHGGGQRNLA
jgi:tellurite resistance protein